MDDYDFITISNGHVIVQHVFTGQVFRFRPVYPGVWTRLILDKVDAPVTAEQWPHPHITAAQVFAEAAAARCCQQAAAWHKPEPPARPVPRFAIRRSRSSLPG